MNKLFSSIFLLAVATACASGDFMINKAQLIANSITQQTAKQIHEAYDFIELRGVGGARNFRELSISLHANRKLTKKFARELIIEFADLYLQNINNNPKVEALAETYPLQIKNIEIILAIMPPEGEVYHPDISLISLADGIVLFWVFDEFGKECGDLSEETYEEARSIVRESQ